ncbi:MAG: DUF1905 domain-containing protein [Bacteroidetes bacterium]|nr:DUF1905 domain-containing protein [Bacteroidota bacterium]
MKPLIHKKFKLQKYPGKGGWTYAVIPSVSEHKNTRFGWIRVKGTIDTFEFKNYHLMPMKDGNFFLPVKAEIRRKINKKEGDWVEIILYPDNDPVEIPQDLLLCLLDEPETHQNFMHFTDAERKAYIQWIDAAKAPETRVRRITKTLERASQGLRLTEPGKE